MGERLRGRPPGGAGIARAGPRPVRPRPGGAPGRCRDRLRRGTLPHGATLAPERRRRRRPGRRQQPDPRRQHDRRRHGGPRRPGHEPGQRAERDRGPAAAGEPRLRSRRRRRPGGARQRHPHLGRRHPGRDPEHGPVHVRARRRASSTASWERGPGWPSGGTSCPIAVRRFINLPGPNAGATAPCALDPGTFFDVFATETTSCLGTDSDPTLRSAPNAGAAFDLTTPGSDPTNHGPVVEILGQGAQPNGTLGLPRLHRPRHPQLRRLRDAALLQQRHERDAAEHAQGDAGRLDQRRWLPGTDVPPGHRTARPERPGGGDVRQRDGHRDRRRQRALRAGRRRSSWLSTRAR